MGALNDQPRVIPLACQDLVALLLADRGIEEEEREVFRSFSDLVQSVHHVEFHNRLRELKAAYRPFDPDVDDILVPLSADEKRQRLNELFRDFAWLLDRAHYVHLGRDEIQQVIAQASDWGIRMDVDFSAFEHIAIFARGQAWDRRARRSWRSFFQLEEIEVPIWRRLVLILKLRPHPRLPGLVQQDQVLLKIFKDIPKMDVDMLLPGARVTLTVLDRSKILGGLLGGVASMVYNLFSELTRLVQELLLSERAFWALAAGSFGYAYKTWYGYRQTKQAYHLALTQSLYFQNLDSNAGVLTRLFDEAEEQASRTTLLGWFCLWRYGGEQGWTTDELDASMDLYLDRYAEVSLVCPPGEALARLRTLGLVEQTGERFRAVPLERARSALQAAWDRLQPGVPAPH
jgi:hypothetical protein